MELTKLKRKELKRGDMFCDANGMLDRPVMMLFIDKHTHHCSPDAEVYRIDTPEQKESRIDEIKELTVRLEECRRAKRSLQEFIDTLSIKIANNDDERKVNATDIELLNMMLEIVNPITRSGEYGHPTQSSKFLSQEMSKLCRHVIMFRRQHKIVG